MNKAHQQLHRKDSLFAHHEAFDQRIMDVGDGHQVYVEQSGNPDGIPIVVCHGGPGGGSNPAMRRFFNPEKFRIILFDQRGCGRSKPHSCVEHNTTWHLVADMELIRTTLGIEQWHVFGGSWGATLSLIYSQTHPDRVLSLVLRGVFLMRQQELDWFYDGGAGQFFPELWEHVISPLPEDERHDVVRAYHTRLFSGHYPTELRFAQLWSGWENALASVDSIGRMGGGSPTEMHAFARLENHYFSNRGWLDDTTDILNRMDKIAHIPATIIQGRQDMICPPQSAHDLAKHWPNARLRMIPHAGHAMSEPPIANALVRATNQLVDELIQSEPN